MKVGVCNLRSNDFRDNFLNSILKTGFAVITHHGIDGVLIKEAQDAWRSFFSQSREYKNGFVDPKDSNMGFTAFGGEKAVGSNKADLKEFYHWKPGCSIPKEAELITYRLFSLLEGDVAGQVLHALNFKEEIDLDFVEACKNSDNTILRALHYPALNEIEVEEGSVRAAAHEDINFITLLVAADSPGLQVQDKTGNWHDVPFEDNSITVNIGDMLQMASRGMFKSTTHRVINPSKDNVSRISMPLFVHANSNTLLAPGFTAQQYLEQRLNEIYKKGYKK